MNRLPARYIPLLVPLTLIVSMTLISGEARADENPPAAPAAVEAPAGEATPVEAAVDGVQRFYEGVTDFKATFKQVVRRKHLPRPLRRQGTVYFKKPGMMRWDYTQPDRVLYVSDGTVLWAYEPAEKMVHKLRVEGSELYSALKFLFGQGKLTEEFNATLEPEVDGLLRLKLIPKKPQPGYKSLVLGVDPTTFQIRVTEMVDPLDNVSEVSFESPSYEPLKPAGFNFTPPEGVRVEDLSKGAGASP